MQEKPISPPLPHLALDAEGIFKLVLVTLLGGIGPGALLAAQTRLFYLILLYPILMTIGTGLLVAISVISFGIKNRPAVAVWTLLIGLQMYGGFPTTR